MHLTNLDLGLSRSNKTKADSLVCKSINLFLKTSSFNKNNPHDSEQYW